MGETVKDEINEQLDKLDTPQQRQVLEFARGLASPAGVSSSKLLQFAGTIARPTSKPSHGPSSKAVNTLT